MLSRASLGHILASEVYRLFSRSRDKYITEKALELITGERKEIPLNAAIKYGIDTEPKAREYLGEKYGKFIYDKHHVTKNGLHASPDGLLLFENGIVEIKCPQLPNALTLVLGEELPQKRWYWQVLAGMAITDAEIGYLFVYNDEAGPISKLFPYEKANVFNDIEQMWTEVSKALDDIEMTYYALLREWELSKLEAGGEIEF